MASNGADGARDVPAFIDLAREPAFALGGVEARPAKLEIVMVDRREVLEPRIMQVLVVLARQRGEVVSRGDLIQACWGGRIVSDDAIDRCISRLRRLAEAFGGFELQTIPRVGYRLTETAPLQSPPAGHEPLLAVLAFDNLSDDPDLAFFSDGLSEEILHAVARRTNVNVIGRSSSLSLRGSEKSARNVARELGATHLLDGSVRRRGDLVRVSVELVECAGQTLVWSESFDRDLAEILPLQDDIAAAVAAALRARFSGRRHDARVDPVAYDLFLQTRPNLDRGSIPPSRAIPMLEKAVTLAPDFAPAWAALAVSRVEAYRRIALDVAPVRVERAEVVAAADRSLELDPGSGTAHIARAHLLPWGEYAGREAEFSTALEADVHSSEARTELGWFLNALGRNEEALRIATEGRTLDPLNTRVANLYAQMLCANGRYEESLRITASFRERWPYAFSFVSAPLFLAATVGDEAEFVRLMAIAQQRHAASPYLRDTLRRASILRDPTPAQRQRLLERLSRQVAETGGMDLALLTLAHHIGLVDETFALIADATFRQRWDEGGPPLAEGSFPPGIIFDRWPCNSLMDDPRFVSLCAKLGLCDYWVQTERWPDCARFVPYDFEAEARRLISPT